MDFAKFEEELLRQWEDRQIFKKTLEKEAPKGSFVFYEGPPTANGKPGIHHVEARAFKDCIPRFRTMQGYHIERKGGWDTHGLPVELEVEKALGLSHKADIEEYGIAKFNEQCRQSVWKYQDLWEQFTRRMGYWLDLDDPYITYKPEYVESLWWVIKQIWDRNLLYKDYRVTPHCPRCGTSLSSHELSQGYKDVKDLSVYAKFKIIGEENTYVVAWTTTPWTLPSNVALAVGEEIEYVKVKKDDDVLILAKDRLEVVEGDYEVIEIVKGSELVGLDYEPLYPFVHDRVQGTDQDTQAAWTIVPADFVTTEDGTGIVHTAVMYGADDFDLGKQVGLPKYHLVTLDGRFLEDTDFLSDRLVTDEDVAIDIIKDLAHRGQLFHKEKYEHTYPHCWRCKSKVIYYAKDSWYINMQEVKGDLIEENTKIHWEPEHLRDGRFGEWLREVKDWAFSRERYWGTPLPIWESEDGERICIGSFEELKKLAKDPSLVGDDFDPHRPFVDEVVLEKDGKTYHRVPDVVDVWFDSGSMPFAQHHYPFENKELVDSGDAFPADYISEAIDQTRGWFYTLLAVSTLLGKGRPYKHVISLGHVLDAEGKKMSKSVGNVVEPMGLMDQYGADAVRWYMYAINQPGEGKRFDEKTLQDMIKKNFQILMNVVRFYKMFEEKGLEGQERLKGQSGEAGPGSAGEVLSREHVLDRWVLARLSSLTKDTTDRLENYVITETVRELGSFITDLSTWYVRRSRDRMKGDNEADKQAAVATLRVCLSTLSKLMAPFTPFLAERVYEQTDGSKESVHLEDWPEVNEGFIDAQVLSDMERVRSVVSLALERRAEAKVNVRQVLGGMTVTLPSGVLDDVYLDLIKDEVNVKEVVVETGDYSVELDLELTPELLREGMIREMARRVNALRKNAGLTINDRIELYVSGSEEVMRALVEHKATLLQGTRATSVRTTGEAPEQHKTFEINEEEVVLGIQS